VWSPYYQDEKYFTGQMPGMGLGLAMVAAIVWGVGGTCRIHNREQGPGVVVELVLPLAQDAEEVMVG
jgi:nitrogen fixation/metabolism regulation signal transduction histidine kinase